MRRRSFLAFTLWLAVLSLAASGSPAGATVTVGQIAPDTTAPRTCASPFDRVQPTVTDGSSYVMPANGTITSWSTTTSADGGGQLKLKVYRHVSGTTYMAVAQDVPRDLALNTINTFSTSLSVKTGDLLGLNSFTGTPDCAFLVTGETYLRVPGDLADGQSADFIDSTVDRRLNVSAVLEPSNTLTFGAITRNKKKGTATITVDVPNPGELIASGNGVKASLAGAVISKSVGAGQAQLLIKAKGKKKRKLNETGKVKLNVAITYTPTGGDPATQSVKVKLKKKL
jgi:hypothetical protein